MGYLELGEIDRKKYGAPERVEFLHHRYGMRSTKALRKVTGFEYETMTRLVAGVPKVDPETNEPVMQDVEDDEGNPVCNDDGSPKRELVLVHDEDAVAALIWLILWDAGHKLDWDTFNPHSEGLRISLADGEDEESGKAQEEPTSSMTTSN